MLQKLPEHNSGKSENNSVVQMNRAMIDRNGLTTAAARSSKFKSRKPNDLEIRALLKGGKNVSDFQRRRDFLRKAGHKAISPPTLWPSGLSKWENMSSYRYSSYYCNHVRTPQKYVSDVTYVM